MLAKMSGQHATGQIDAIFMLEVKRWIVRASTEPARSRDRGTKASRTKALHETAGGARTAAESPRVR